MCENAVCYSLVLYILCKMYVRQSRYAFFSWVFNEDLLPVAVALRTKLKWNMEHGTEPRHFDKYNLWICIESKQHIACVCTSPDARNNSILSSIDFRIWNLNREHVSINYRNALQIWFCCTRPYGYSQPASQLKRCGNMRVFIVYARGTSHRWREIKEERMIAQFQWKLEK